MKILLVFSIIIEVTVNCINPIYTVDFPWQLEEGNYILNHGTVGHNPLQAYGDFSPAFANEYIAYEVLIASINHLLGSYGLCLFFGVISFALFAPALLAIYRNRTQFSIIYLIIFLLAQYALIVRLEERPELIADLCFLTVLRLLIDKSNRLWTWWEIGGLGAIFTVWSNVHGTFLLGGVMLGMYYLQNFLLCWRNVLNEKNWRFFLPGLSALIGTCCNPVGIYRFIQPFQLHSLVWGQGTSLEMWPSYLNDSWFTISLAISILCLYVFRIKQWTLIWSIFFLFFIVWLGFISTRYTVLTGLIALTFLSLALSIPKEKKHPEQIKGLIHFAQSTMNCILALIFIFFVLGYLQGKLFSNEKYIYSYYPNTCIVQIPALKTLEEASAIPCFLLSSTQSGSFAQFSSPIKIHPLIDSGRHRFSDRVNQLYYYSLFSPKITQKILEKLHINAIILESHNYHWASVINNNASWKLVSVNLNSQLYVKNNQTKVQNSKFFIANFDHDIHQNTLKLFNYYPHATIRGLFLRPDTESFQQWIITTDYRWMCDPELTYFQIWLAQCPDSLVEDQLALVDKNTDSTCPYKSPIKLVLLLRLHRDKEAALLADQWNPPFWEEGWEWMQLLRADVYLADQDVPKARNALESIWPQPRYSLRWAKICQQVYAQEPSSMPSNAKKLVDLCDHDEWVDDEINVLNNRIDEMTKQDLLK